MSGIIYQITNVVNGNIYIGKTKKTLEDRFQKHKYNAKYGLNTHLYKAMRKYGVENFQIKSIELCEDLDSREVFWIEKLNPHYNMTKGGEGGDTSLSPNFKKAMNEYHTRKPSSEYATYGMKGKPSRFKGKSLEGNYKPVSCDGIIFPSIKMACEHFKGISVYKRLDNPKYENWYRLPV